MASIIVALGHVSVGFLRFVLVRVLRKAEPVAAGSRGTCRRPKVPPTRYHGTDMRFAWTPKVHQDAVYYLCVFPSARRMPCDHRECDSDGSSLFVCSSSVSPERFSSHYVIVIRSFGSQSVVVTRRLCSSSDGSEPMATRNRRRDEKPEQ